MIRFVVIGVVVVLAWVLLLKLFREMKGRDIDWTGVAAFVGFVALAFYLHHATGIG